MCYYRSDVHPLSLCSVCHYFLSISPSAPLLFLAASLHLLSGICAVSTCSAHHSALPVSYVIVRRIYRRGFTEFTSGVIRGNFRAGLPRSFGVTVVLLKSYEFTRGFSETPVWSYSRFDGLTFGRQRRASALCAQLHGGKSHTV